ncbi:hypothetical protein ONV75_08810 [Clostridium sp. LQ25]|uniref:hypothetical protein n=1 Tax=Clostridium TaxID=1485 RepID=UPI0005EBC378|nr:MULTISPECIES: hypothetical protein [Clostridium]MDU3583244.1 hypothetical protein [Clostridium butyricum]MDU3596533.1 hypothetical protein [Clostridium butyricum]UZT07956.1 hypothetical protein ONV75_08810 [Clostridium sp. LQ25]
MIKNFINKKSKKYTVGQLSNVYDILKTNKSSKMFTKTDTDSVRRDWQFVGRDLNWGIEKIQEEEQKLKLTSK